MFKESVFLVLVIAAVIGMFALDAKREVDVTLCESGGVTTYVGRRVPMAGMTFGECRVMKVEAQKYWEMRRVMRSSNGMGR